MSRKISARCRLLPGDASKYIDHCEFGIKAGDRVVLVCRVSYRHQEGHLADQERYLRQWVTARGAIVVAVIRCVWSGTDPMWLAPAVAMATKHGAKILAESTDRLVRHPAFHPREWPDAQARDCDLVWLRYCTRGLTLATLLHPNALPGEARGHQTKRGQAAPGARGGRPATRPGYKKRRRAKLMPQARVLIAEGVPQREVARRLNLCESTVRLWVRSFLASGELLKCD